MNDEALPSGSRIRPALDEPPSSSRLDDSDEGRVDKRLQLEKRIAFLDHLILNLDIMIYLQFSVLYYMNPSLFLLVLVRVVPQWIYLTPKSLVLPPFPVTTRPYILLFFAVPLLIALLHLIVQPAAAGEATRFYLHGGIITDFVGQLSPVSKTRLVATDLLVWMLQLIMLAVSLERRKLSGGSDETAAAGVSIGSDEEARSRQDHDAEERGERRATNAETTNGIELQSLRRRQSGSDTSRERDDLLANDSAAKDRHPLDDFNSGECIVAHLDLVNMARAQWSQRDTFRIDISGPAGAQIENPNALATAILAGRNLDLPLRSGGQPLDT